MNKIHRLINKSNISKKNSNNLKEEIYGKEQIKHNKIESNLFYDKLEILKDEMKKFKYNKFYSSLNEWVNSIYSYDKKQVINTIFKNKITYVLLDSYFNMEPSRIKKRFSLKRIFVSTAEIKDIIGNSINITVYIFNKEIKLLLKKINRLNHRYIIRSMLIPNRAVFSIKEKKSWKKVLYKFNNNNKNWVKHMDYTKSEDSISKSILIKKNIFIYSLFADDIINEKFYASFLFNYYMSKLMLNLNKFSILNLLNLKKILYIIYGKKININIVNLKYLYMDNSIYINAIVRKLRDRKKKVLRVIRKARNLVKRNRLHFVELEHFKLFLFVYYKYYDLIKYNFNDYLYIKRKNIRENIYRTLKNVLLIGVRLEAKGRLTRRLTASRSVHKIAYKGKLKNIYSSFQKKPALLIKGFQKSNVEYLNSNSYNRMGSYGIKTYINSY